MSKAKCFGLLCLGLIGGCTSGRLQQAVGQVNAANTECDARFASGEFKNTRRLGALHQ
jgi:hypothetical protein